MNDITKFFYCGVICLVLGGLFGAGGYHAITAAETERAITERDRLIEQYRGLDVEAARANRELAHRNSRLEEGLGELREITSGSIKDIRSAVNILAGVKSILTSMEEYSDIWRSGGVSGGTD